MKTGKSYIGYTGDGILFRWEKHLLAARTGVDYLFYRAIRKYGAAAWTGTVLVETDNKKDAEAAETLAIIEHQTLAPKGYNCTLGGTGGNTWFGPNVSRRKARLSSVNAGLSNANSSGISDEQILKAAERCWLVHRNWKQSEWLKICHIEGLPKHLRPFRFQKYGGGMRGLKAALLERLKEHGEEVETIKYARTAEHNQNAGRCNRGKIWVTDVANKRSYLAPPTSLTQPNIIKGRLYVNH